MTAAQETELRRIVDEALADFEHRMIYGESKTLYGQPQIPISALLGESPLAMAHEALAQPELLPSKPWIQKAIKRAPKQLGIKRS